MHTKLIACISTVSHLLLQVRFINLAQDISRCQTVDHCFVVLPQSQNGGGPVVIALASAFIGMR